MFIGGSKNSPKLWFLQRVLEVKADPGSKQVAWFKAGFAVTVAFLPRRSQSKQAEKFVLLQRDGNSDDLSLLEDNINPQKLRNEIVGTRFLC